VERYAYYVCFKCKKAYYGGEAQCDADAAIGDEYNPVSRQPSFINAGLLVMIRFKKSFAEKFA
jgi:hypothetical protein